MKPFSLEEHLKNPERKVVTREGKPARIICTDLDDNECPVVAAISNWHPLKFTAYGIFHIGKETKYDLFFAPEKHEGWFNIYHCDDLGFYIRQNQPYKSKEEADEIAKANFRTFFATVKVEWEE